MRPVLLLPALLLAGNGAHAAASAPTHDELGSILLALALIVLAAHAGGWLAQRFLRQPRVVGEIAAGLMLGPSVLGALLPGVHAALFPAGVAPFLGVIAQLGVVLFMFLVGLELNPGELRRHGRTAGTVALAGMALPLLLGLPLAHFLAPEYAPAGVRPSVFMLFIGVSLSVTAFPVLARILTERGLTHTRVGQHALAAAALSDVLAWLLLALCVAVAAGNYSGVRLALVGTLLFVLAMVALRPWLARQLAHRNAETGLLAAVSGGLLLAAASTQFIGIHALFGAFLFGLILPHEGRFADSLRARLESVALVLLLPVFFALVGTRTRIDLIGPAELGVFGLIVLVAVAGKAGGCYLAARANGLPRQDAAPLAVLMNTRGLMELIVLKLGLDLGIIDGRLFTLLVLMALLTTMLTPPLLDWLQRRQANAPASERPEPML